MTTKKIALFIDADNVSPKYGKQIIEMLSSRGELSIRRIYGNWEKLTLRGWNDAILNYSLRAVQQPDFTTGKNATDMSLTIDAMDVLHEGKVEVFAIVSNDSDFTPLVIRLREGDKNIIGLGNANASNAFRAACNEFIELNTLTESKPAPAVEEKNSHGHAKKSSVQMSLFDQVESVEPPVKTNPKVISLEERKLQSERDKKIQQMHDALHESADLHGNAEGFSSLNHARQDVRKKNFSFTVHDFGYGQLKDFIAAYPKLYETRQDENGQRFTYRCRTTERKAVPVVDGDKLRQMHCALHEATSLHADGTGFANLCSVGSYIVRKNLGFAVQDLGFGSLQRFIEAFPDVYELHRDEQKIFIRCRAVDAKKPADGFGQVHSVLRETAETYGDDRGFAQLSRAGAAILQKKLSIKDSGHGTLQKFVCAFPKLYEVQKVGQIVSYRCKSEK